jgi:hypothetical protein
MGHRDRPGEVDREEEEGVSGGSITIKQSIDSMVSGKTGENSCRKEETQLNNGGQETMVVARIETLTENSNLT